MKLVLAVATCALISCGGKKSEEELQKEVDKALAGLEKEMKADMKADMKSAAGAKAEAELQLHRIGKLTKTAQAEKAEFPKGTVGPTPASDCCSGGCKPDAAAWADPTWKSLGFAMDETHHFQYSYDSDGKTFTAQAIGCGDHAGTWTATGRIDAGNAVVEVSGP